MGFKKNNPGCKCCGNVSPVDCGFCSGGVTPLLLPLTILGWGVGGIFPCTTPQCATLNGTFQLSQTAACSWGFIHNLACQQYQVTARLVAVGAGVARWITEARITAPGVSPYYSLGGWYLDVTDPVDCFATRTMANFTSGYNSPSPPLTPFCDPSALTCQIF